MRGWQTSIQYQWYVLRWTVPSNNDDVSSTVFLWLTHVEDVDHGLRPQCVVQRHHRHGVGVAAQLWDDPLPPEEGDKAAPLPYSTRHRVPAELGICPIGSHDHGCGFCVYKTKLEDKKHHSVCRLVWWEVKSSDGAENYLSLSVNTGMTKKKKKRLCLTDILKRTIMEQTCSNINCPEDPRSPQRPALNKGKHTFKPDSEKQIISF